MLSGIKTVLWPHTSLTSRCIYRSPITNTRGPPRSPWWYIQAGDRYDESLFLPELFLRKTKRASHWQVQEVRGKQWWRTKTYGNNWNESLYPPLESLYPPLEGPAESEVRSAWERQQEHTRITIFLNNRKHIPKQTSSSKLGRSPQSEEENRAADVTHHRSGHLPSLWNASICADMVHNILHKSQHSL